jgi:hypothetical protein
MFNLNTHLTLYVYQNKLAHQILPKQLIENLIENRWAICVSHADADMPADMKRLLWLYVMCVWLK